MLNKTTLFILLFIGCSQQNEHDSVARVNGAILTKQMLEDISEKNKTFSRNEHISGWIEEELLYQAGKKHGVLRDKQVQTTVDAFTRSLTIKKYINIIVSKLSGLNGFFGIDFIIFKKQILFVDINPRITTSYKQLSKNIKINVAEKILNTLG